MSEITNIGSLYALPPLSRESSASTIYRPQTSTPTVDTVEFSRRGTDLAKAMEESSMRIARTRAIREQIQNGTFETPERINGTVDRLLDIIV